MQISFYYIGSGFCTRDIYPLIYSKRSYNILKDTGVNFIYKDIKDIESLNILDIEHEFSNFNNIIDK